MIKTETVKINNNENACLNSGNLLMDGAFYNPDYEWFFSVKKQDIPRLFLHTLSTHMIGSSELTDICKKYDINYKLNVWQ